MLLVLLIFALTVSDVLAAGAPVRIDGGDTITALSDATVTTTTVLIAASNSSRAALNCTTDQPVRWGGSSTTSTLGQQIAANASIEIRNTAAVYMAAESATATVTCTQETFASSTGTGVFSP